MIRPIILTLFILLASGSTWAQKTWSLEECITHALEHNIDLKVRQNMSTKDTYSRKMSQWELLPSVNGWGNSSFDVRRSTNQNNEIASGPSYNMNYGIGASLTLFSGFTRLNTISALRFSELAGMERTHHAANLLTIAITGIYTRVLYQKALVEVFKEQLMISKLESERIAANIDVGLLEPVAQLEIDAIISSQQLQMTSSENEYQLLKLKLAHLIEIPEASGFDISSAEIDTQVPQENQHTMDEIYSLACQFYPSILQKELEMGYYKKMLHASRGNAVPSLRINAGQSSAFFSTDTLMDGTKTPVSTQFSNYLNPYVGLSLSIPIFNGRRNEFQIKQRKIDLENALYILEEEKKTIRREIEEAQYRLEAFRLEYQYATNNLMLAEKSFETFRERYRLGIASSTEFMNAQNQVMHARSEQLRVKYSWVVQKQTLELYKGKSLIDNPLSLKKQDEETR